MKRRKTVKLAVVSDTHAPDHDDKSLSWACRQISDFKPDYLVHGGDLFEADAGSRFYNEKKHDLRDEQRSAAAILDALAAAWPGADRWFLAGNHDSHLSTPGRIDKRVRSAVHWNVCEWKESFLRWKQKPYDFSPNGVLQLGQVVAWHGHDGSEEQNALRIINACGGHAHRLVIGGHTHKPHGPTQIMRGKNLPLPFWYANSGTLGPLRPSWTQRQDTSLWAPAIVKVELQMGRACQPGRNWECVVEVMS